MLVCVCVCVVCVCARVCDTGYLYVPFHLLYSFLTLHRLQCDLMNGSAMIFGLIIRSYMGICENVYM